MYNLYSHFRSSHGCRHQKLSFHSSQLILFTDSPPPAPSCLATAALFSVSIRLSLVLFIHFVVFCLISQIWVNHMVFVFYLIDFTLHNTLRAHPCYCKWQDFVYFKGGYYSHVHISHLLAGDFVHWDVQLWNVLLFFFFFFRATPTAYGSSQARDGIEATAASLHLSHSNTRSELCLQATPQLAAMLAPKPTERGQGSNLHPHGYWSDSFPLHHNENSPFI